MYYLSIMIQQQNNTIMTQYEQLINAIKDAKTRNNDLVMSLIKEEKVTLLHADGFDGSDNTIKSSLQAMIVHGYYYADTELERVLSILSEIK